MRALLHERRAWVIAQDATRPDAARKALDIAGAALAERDPGHAPDWAAWADHTELQIMTGRCLTRLGQPLAAIPVLHAALDGFDDTQARDKALYMSWLAEAYLDAGEIDTAAAVASNVFTLSARRRIGTPRPAAARHHRTAGKPRSSTGSHRAAGPGLVSHAYADVARLIHCR